MSKPTRKPIALEEFVPTGKLYPCEYDTCTNPGSVRMGDGLMRCDEHMDPIYEISAGEPRCHFCEAPATEVTMPYGHPVCTQHGDTRTDPAWAAIELADVDCFCDHRADQHNPKKPHECLQGPKSKCSCGGYKANS